MGKKLFYKKLSIQEVDACSWSRHLKNFLSNTFLRPCKSKTGKAFLLLPISHMVPSYPLDSCFRLVLQLFLLGPFTYMWAHFNFFLIPFLRKACVTWTWQSLISCRDQLWNWVAGCLQHLPMCLSAGRKGVSRRECGVFVISFPDVTVTWHEGVHSAFLVYTWNYMLPMCFKKRNQSEKGWTLL